MLQAAAIKMAIQSDTDTLDPVKFTDNLSEFIRPYEPSEALDKDATAKYIIMRFPSSVRIHTTAMSSPTYRASTTGVEIDYMLGQPTCLSQLRQIREFLLCEEPPAPFLVQQALGHGVMAGKHGFTSQ